MSPPFECFERLDSGWGLATVPVAGTSLNFKRRLSSQMPDLFFPFCSSRLPVNRAAALALPAMLYRMEHLDTGGRLGLFFHRAVGRAE